MDIINYFISFAEKLINKMVIGKELDGRIVWLDWMKVWAILAIIWGHFFSAGYLYLYVFSVQVFCVISGFLYKRAPDWKTCIKKLFWQLLVPTIIMSVLMQLEAYYRCLASGGNYVIPWPWFFKWFMLGHRWCMGPCWYFYSLIVMRLIMQVLPEKKWVYLILFIVISAGAILWQQTGIKISNANINVLVCMPFFLLGVFLKSLKNILNGLDNLYLEFALLIFSIGAVVLCGHYNGYVWMYLCEYGNYFVLYILGGMAGSVMLYIVSLWLSRLPYRNMMMTISKGSILIIGLHIVVVRRLTDLPDRIWFEDLAFAVLLLLCFIPIIRFAELFCPLLLGKR